MTSPVRVLIADDHALIRAGFRVLLDSHPGIVVIAEAEDGEDAVRLARDLRPDIVLMDVRMPGRDGLWATQQITSDRELAAVKVVVLTTFEVDEHVFGALRAGASGFLSKAIDPDELPRALLKVVAGDALLSPHATRTLMRQFIAQPAVADPARPSLLETSPIANSRWSRSWPAGSPTTRSRTGSTSPR